MNDTAPDGLAWPRDFDARSADGLDRVLVLGGGGLYLLAWHVGYLHELAERGIDLQHSDRLVGTSAGSVMATGLAAGKLGRLHTLVGALDKRPGVIARMAPAGELSASQQRARDLFWFMADASLETRQRVGHAALAAGTPSADSTARTLSLVLGVRSWPSASLHITCVDTYSGERCVVTEAAGVRPARAVAASSAVPGIFAPQPIGDRRCMDGGVSDSGVHADLACGARRAVILSLPDYVPAAEGFERSITDVHAEIAALEAAGTQVFHRVPESADFERLMDPTMVSEAFAMGHRQAASDAEELRTFLAR